MKKIKENDEEIELYEQDDVDKLLEEKLKEAEEENAKVIEEKIEEFKKENPDNKEEMEKLTKDLKEANEKLEKGTEGGKKKEGEDKDTEQVTRLKETINGLKETVDELGGIVTGDTKKDLLDKLSEGDEETRKKLELEFDGFEGDVKSKEDITARMVKAATIVKGSEPTLEFMDNLAVAPGKGNDPTPEKGQETEGAKVQRKLLDISDEDAKKFAPKEDANN